MDLGKDKIQKIYIKYLIPAMCSAVVMSFYYVADTVMIGHGIGGNGLIALNIVLPVFSFLYGFGYLCGVGGSVLLSVAKGRGDQKEADGFFSTSLILVLGISVLLTAFLYGFRREVCFFLGATEENVSLVLEYGNYLFGFAWLFILFPYMQTFVRNDKNPKLAMTGSIVGSLLNVVLDYIFIFMMDMGLAGAIVATVIGSVVNVLITVLHFFTKKNTLHFSWKLFSARKLVQIMASGATSFISELASGFVILIFNWQILKYIGDAGIVVYSTISNTVLITIAMCNGIGTAMQPIVSYNYGAGLGNRIRDCRRLALKISAVLNTVIYVLIYYFAELLIYLYVKPTEYVVQMGIPAIRIYFLCVFPMLINLFYASYYQAIVKGSWSFLISILRGFVFSIVLVVLLPHWLGGNIIWWVTPLAESLTFCVTLLLQRAERKHMKVLDAT